MAADPKPSSRPSSAPAEEAGAGRDVVLVGGPTEDGKGRRVLRAGKDSLSVGEVRPLEEGKPLHAGEIVKLHPHKDTPQVCDVEVVHRVEARADADGCDKARTGPAQVATRAYRERWEQVFKDKKDHDDEPN